MYAHVLLGIVALVLTPLASARADYALAYGTSGKRWSMGYSHNAPTYDAAKKSALEGCNFKSCRVVLSGRGQCAALAVSRQNSAAAWNAADTLAAAREASLISCSEKGLRCTIEASFCDRSGTADSAVVPPTLPTAAPTSSPVTGTPSPGGFTDALKTKLRSCINLAGVGYGADDTVRLVLGLDDAGMLAFPPTVSAVGSGSNAGNFATRLVVALNRCAPYNALPGIGTATWKNIAVDFAPGDFR